MRQLDPLPPEAPDALIAIEQTDIAVAEKAAEVRHHPLIRTLGRASEMADQPPLFVAGAALLLGGLALRRPLVALAGGRMLAAHSVGIGLKTIVKRSVDRTRPDVLADEDRYEIARGEHDEPRFNSFPSGHTTGAVAVAQALGRTIPVAAWPARAWALAIAALQIPRCKHYLSDVGAGAAIGFASDGIIRLAERAARGLLRR